MKLQNIFFDTVNQDSDGRFVDSSELIDAENSSYTVDGSNNGVGKCLGNAIKTAYGIVGAKTIGHGKDSTLDYYTTS
jgi:hypothetical protein